MKQSRVYMILMFLLSWVQTYAALHEIDNSGKYFTTTKPYICVVALIGGGSTFQPGEISLAHHGILFLDELPEFNRTAIETLRQPLEDRRITINRAKYRIDLPCSFQLIAAMNPCPCGFYNDPHHHCECNPGQVKRYLNKISGPLLDRIDIQVEVVPLTFDEISRTSPGESSMTIRERVMAARAIQTERFKEYPNIHCNAQMSSKLLHNLVQPDEAGLQLLKSAMDRFNMSARAYEKILKVARTIADLAGSENIQFNHLAEAIGYRNLDRGDWAERSV